MMIRISATSSQFSLQCFPVVKTSSSSVRRHRDAVKDVSPPSPGRAFVGQEAMHRAPASCPQRAPSDPGVPDRTRRPSPLATCRSDSSTTSTTLAVAATAAAEHLTGVFAAVVLSDDRTRHLLFSQPEVEPLIAWHALEKELEHKNGRVRRDNGWCSVPNSNCWISSPSRCWQRWSPSSGLRH